MAMAYSFEDLALSHVVVGPRANCRIIFLDTLGHFDQTYEFVDRIERDWSLNLERAIPDADAWPCGSEQCCQRCKVEPLKQAVSGYSAWITSVKRVNAPSCETIKTLLWARNSDWSR